MYIFSSHFISSFNFFSEKPKKCIGLSPVGTLPTGIFFTLANLTLINYQKYIFYSLLVAQIQFGKPARIVVIIGRIITEIFFKTKTIITALSSHRRSRNHILKLQPQFNEIEHVRSAVLQLASSIQISNFFKQMILATFYRKLRGAS